MLLLYLAIVSSAFYTTARASIVNKLAASRHAVHNVHGLEPGDALPKAELSTSRFWSDITAPFSVSGSKLPDIDFDIGESCSGLLPIDDTGKELFFWFVPSTNPLAEKEITIWLNGGPGCSSLDGFIHEQGPLVWHKSSPSPVRNAWTWTQLTNMVWVEQPVGTGCTQGESNATSSQDIAMQFLPFWINFVNLFGLHS